MGWEYMSVLVSYVSLVSLRGSTGAGVFPPSSRTILNHAISLSGLDLAAISDASVW